MNNKYLHKTIAAFFIISISINIYASPLGVGIELYNNTEYKKSKEILLEKEHLKNSLSSFYLGEMYFHGYGVKEDKSKALSYYLLSAKLNNIDSMFKVAKMYQKGNGVKKNLSKVNNWYLELIKTNNLDVMNKVLNLVKPNKDLVKKIILILEKNSKKGNINSKKTLSFIYFKNYFGIKNAKYAAQLMKDIVKQEDDIYAFTRLGRYYLQMYYENQKPSDAKEAIKFNQKAADLGENYSQYRLGEIYEYGIGTQKDLKKATYWYLQSANQGNNSAKLKLNDLLIVKLSKKESLEYKRAITAFKNKNYKEAHKYFLFDSKNDSVSSHRSRYNLGLIYEDALDVSKDMKESFKWYLKSATQGFARAQLKVAKLYRIGKGATLDKDKALFWYKKAYLNGSSDALDEVKYLRKYKAYSHSMLGDVKWEGKKKLAFKIMLYLANTELYSDDSFDLAQAYLDGYGTKKNLSKAIKWYKKSAKKGNSEAAYSIAKLYEERVEIKKDKHLAKIWYEKALSLQTSGHTKSQRALVRLYLQENKIDFDKKVLYSLEEESKRNNPEATYFLAELYSDTLALAKLYSDNSDKFSKINKAKSLFFYKKASEMGYAKAQFKLGYMYERKSMYEKDLIKKKEYQVSSFKWYEKAAKQKHINAMYKISRSYRYGKTVKKDLNKYQSILNELISLGEKQALLSLAYFNKNQTNIEKSISLYKKAYKQFSSIEALEQLTNIYTYRKEDYKKTVYYYKKLYALGKKGYALNIAEIYGKNIKDIKQMNYWYKEAIKIGDMTAVLKYAMVCRNNPDYNCSYQ